MKGRGTIWTTRGETTDDTTETLYEGSNPIEAVRQGLTAPARFLLTWVEEDGQRIPQTEAM